MKDRVDDYSLSVNFVEDYVRGTTDHEFPNTGFNANSAKTWKIPQNFHDGNNAGGETLRSFGLILGDESANFA